MAGNALTSVELNGFILQPEKAKVQERQGPVQVLEHPAEISDLLSPVRCSAHRPRLPLTVKPQCNLCWIYWSTN